MIPNQRHKFNMPETIAYLNCAYMSPLMDSVRAAMLAGVESKGRPWHYKPADFFSPSEEFRKLAARVIHGRPDTIAIIPSVSYGMQIAANNLPLSQDGEILVLAEQFPSNIYPWREKVKTGGGHIHTLARPDDNDWTQVVLGAIGPRTEIVALPATHWADGAYLDLEVIGKAARSAGAALVLDLTQSLGAMPFDVNKVQPDFMVAACYKWLMGPYTSAMLYIAPKWHEGVPLEHTWMGRLGAEDFSNLLNYQDEFQPGARRFDMGEKSSPAQLNGAIAALTQVLDWGVENISTTLGARNTILAEQARDMGYVVAPDHLRSPHFLGLGFPKGIPDGFADTLAAKNIYVSVRGSSVRVTPHLYNTDGDMQRFMDILRSL